MDVFVGDIGEVAGDTMRTFATVIAAIEHLLSDAHLDSVAERAEVQVELGAQDSKFR